MSSLAAQHARRSKIICTLGPASESDDMIRQLLSCGMDAVRINLGFGELATHVDRIARIRRVANESHRPVAIIADLPGRKLRLGALAKPSITTTVGQELDFVASANTEHEDVLTVPPAFFHDNMARGDKLLLADGHVEMEVTDVNPGRVRARVIVGGPIDAFTGVNAEGLVLTGRVLTNQDKQILQAIVGLGIDFVALSYVTEGQEVLEAREYLSELGAPIPIIAKIERAEAFSRLDGILQRADVVMLRRGELAAQMEFHRIPLVQQEVLRLANQRGVPVIMATQMLGSMVHSPRPTRAEASDVSNAVVDGADGLLLSAETAIGTYPCEAVRIMHRIIVEAEQNRTTSERPHIVESFPSPFADTTARIACQAAEKTQAKWIVCFTESGRTAQLVAKYRPRVPMLAFCNNPSTRRRLALWWGVRSDTMEVQADVDTMVRAIDGRLLARGLAAPGDRLAIVFGAPVGEKGHTNSVRLHEVGSTD